jgi:hypothetical protein
MAHFSPANADEMGPTTEDLLFSSKYACGSCGRSFQAAIASVVFVQLAARDVRRATGSGVFTRSFPSC